MKVSILKRIDSLEQKMKQKATPPDLIMIHYDDRVEHKWIVVEHYFAEKSCKSKTSTFEHLQQFFFSADFKGRVILDTFNSIDPTICGNLFCFDIDDLREENSGEIAIRSISEPEDEKSITVAIEAFTK